MMIEYREVPNLLCPAGSLEKLKVAVDYGADAVYLGGQKFGLRAASENFTLPELEKGVRYAHQQNSKVFVTLNSFFHESDFVELDEFIKFLTKIGVDALIVSDLGVIQYLNERGNSIPIHLSTQSSCVNHQTAMVYKSFGIKRVVVGREVSLEDAKKIQQLSGLEVESFVHGSMCMSYSGHCVISNYTAGRDSNRGGCAHSCRFHYELKNLEDQSLNESTFMSSKDLNGIELLGHYVDAGVHTIKIEGRMKSVHYLATVTKCYREALDQLKTEKKFTNEQIKRWQFEFKKLSHRGYTTGSLLEPADEKSVFDERNYKDGPFDIVGEVIEAKQNEFVIIKIRKAVNANDQLEILPFSLPVKKLSENIRKTDVMDNTFERLNPGRLLKIPWIPGTQVRNIVRSFSKRENFEV